MFDCISLVFSNIITFMEFYCKKTKSCLFKFFQIHYCYSKILIIPSFVTLHMSKVLSPFKSTCCTTSKHQFRHFADRASPYIYLSNWPTWCTKFLFVKQKFCASSWSITEINIRRCAVSKLSKLMFRCCATCFEHMCSSSGGQNCITQPLVSSHL